MKTTSKILSLALAFLMVLSMFPSMTFKASAADADATGTILTPQQRFNVGTTPSKYGLIYVDTNGELRLSRDDNALKLRKADTLPSSYSSKDMGYITSVRNQGNYGTCWAFAVCAASESSLIKNNGYPLNTTKFAPGHLAYWSYSDAHDKLGLLTGDKTTMLSSYDAYDFGGSNFIASYTITKGTGPVAENDYPYGTYPGSSGKAFTSDQSYQNTIDAQIKNIYWVDYSNREDIKKMIMQYGAGTFGYYVADNDSDYEQSGTYNGAAYTSYAIANGINYDSSTKTYENQYPNHDITVIGWDDNFPAANFASTTGVTENGAWLCKNSWGTSYGSSGYYWISYQDFANSGDTAAFFEYETEAPYDNIYQYDGTSSIGYYYTDEGGYMGNVFTADSDETLKAVSFFTLDTNVDYTVNVYKNVVNTPTSGTLVSSAAVSGTTSYMQYVTVPLNTEVQIDKGEKYAVVVKFNTGKCLPVDCSDTITGYYKFTNATSAGQSYYSANGTSWTDVSSETYYTESNYSFRVKALTNEREPDPVAATGVTLDQTSVSIPQSTSITLTATVAPEDATNKAVTWTSSDETIATVVDGKVTAANDKTGTATITATTVDGNYKASCTVTVTEFKGGFLEATKADFKGNDRFMLTVTIDGVVYAMKNVADTTDKSGLVGAAVSGGTTQASKMATAVWAPIRTSVMNNTDASLIWETEANNDGTYMIKSAATGEYLYANSSSNGVSLGTTSANWTITDTADGESVILSIGTSKELYYRKSSAVFKTYASGKTDADYVVPQAYVYEVNPDDIVQYTVEANTLDETMGLVSGNGTYDSGTNATVTATASEGYKFVNWTDDNDNVISTDNPYTFMVTDNTVLWATFEENVVTEDPVTPIEGAYIEVTADTTFKAGDRLMVVANNGTNLYAMNTTVGTSSSNMLQATEVTLTQIANNTDNTLTWVVETVNDDGTFTIKNASTGTYLYSTSSSNGVSLKTNAANWTFDSNMVLSVGGSSGKALLLNKSATEYKTYAYSNRTNSSYIVPTLYILTEGAEAPVEPTKYTITFDIIGNGSISYNGTSYTNGQSVQLYENTSATFTATPDSGYLLDCWMDGDANIIEGKTYTFTVTGDTTLTAEFVVDTTPVKVAKVYATPGSSSIVAGSSVELSCATDGAKIYYSVNGGASWVEYVGAIVIDSFPTEIMTYATATGYEDSDVSTYIYEEKVVVPPAEGSYVLSTSEAPADGEYIIAANLGDAGYYSIKSELASGKYTSETISVTDNVVDLIDGIHTFAIKSLGNGQYSIYDNTAGKYVTYASGTNLGLSDTAYAFTIVYDTDGYEIVSAANTGRGMLYSVDSNAYKFGGYSASNFGKKNYYRISLFKCNSSEPEQDKTYTVSLDVMGNGSVTYNDTVYTGSNNKITVAEGTEITLTAVPDANNSFGGWLDEDGNESTEASYTFTVGKDIYIIASFNENPSAMVGASFTGNGTITVNGETADDLISVYVGDTVTFTATPDDDSYFVSWVINGTVYNTTEVAYTVTSTDDIDASATFALKYNFDGTGNVDADDVYMLQMYLTGEVDTMDNIAYADVNGDGQVNLLDAFVLYIKINAQTTTTALRGETISVGGFEKVNDLADISAGDQIIFVYNDLAINNVVDGSGHTAGVSVSYIGDYIVNPDTSLVWVVGINEEETYKYSFQSADSNVYLANTGSANKITFTTEPSKFNIESYINNGTGESLYKITNTGKGLAYRKSTYNYFSFYAPSNLSVSSKEYFGVKIYKYNPELRFDEADQLTITTAVAEGQEEMGTVSNNAIVYKGGSASIKATANEKYNFVSWTITGEDGTVITSEDATYTFSNVSQNYTAVASFKLKPICDLEISAIRGTNTVVTQLSVGDIVYFNTKNLIVTSEELKVSYKIGESGEWVEGTSYTVTGEETYPLTVYVKAEAEGYDTVEASATYDQYSIKTGDYGRVITESNITEGSYIIVAEFEGKYYALTSALNNSNKLIAKEITIENGVISVDNSLASSIVTFSDGKTDDYGLNYVLSTDLGIIKQSSTTSITYGTGTSFYVKADEENEGLYKLVLSSTIAAATYRTLTLSYSETAQVFGGYSNASSGNYVFSVMLFKYGATPEQVTPDEPVVEYSAHDFNHDGIVNATDVKLLQQYLTGEAMAEDTLGTLTAAEVVANIEANGDIDSNASINLLDVYLLNVEVLSL